MIECEICESKLFDLIATQIREGEGRIMMCRQCGLIIQSLDWNAERLREYYESEYQETNSLVTGKIQSPLEHFNDRLKTIDPIFEKIKPLLSTEAQVLEIGCGAGALLSLIKPHVSGCVGVELYKPFVEFIRKELGIEAIAQDVNTLNLGKKFDLVISIDCLDHLSNPYETVLTMRDLLKDNGKIYIEVPNQQDGLNLYLPETTRKEYNRFFWHRAHLFYFTKDTISALFQRAGLGISVSCRHNYTLKNYLNWYFLGKPQTRFLTGTQCVDFFSDNSPFEKRMNNMFRLMEREFKKIMAETFHGDSLCCMGWIEEKKT